MEKTTMKEMWRQIADELENHDYNEHSATISPNRSMVKEIRDTLIEENCLCGEKDFYGETRKIVDKECADRDDLDAVETEFDNFYLLEKEVKLEQKEVEEGSIEEFRKKARQESDYRKRWKKIIRNFVDWELPNNSQPTNLPKRQYVQILEKLDRQASEDEKIEELAFKLSQEVEGLTPGDFTTTNGANGLSHATPNRTGWGKIARELKRRGKR